MTSSISKNYLPQLDIIRAIASLAVAIYHLGGKTMPLLKYGWLGVQMFFILTGFVICWSLPNDYKLKNFPIFLFKRVTRIEPPYMVSIILILLVAVVNQNLHQLSLTNILLHFAYLNNFYGNDFLSPVYWTLGIEFQFYILIGILFPFILKDKYLAVICLTLLNLVSIFLPSKYTFVTNYFPYFTFGILIYLYKIKQLQTIETFTFLSLIIIYLYFNFGFANSFIALITGYIMLYIQKSNWMLNFFAKISFSLYLTHDIIGSKVVIFLGHIFPGKNILTKGFAFTLGLTVAILFAYLFYLVVEKTFIIVSKKITY